MKKTMLIMMRRSWREEEEEEAQRQLKAATGRAGRLTMLRSSLLTLKLQLFLGLSGTQKINQFGRERSPLSVCLRDSTLARPASCVHALEGLLTSSRA
mmetsp:Transcript_26836/g.58356  ORF Transcript_26836/g.58356 Transcript_26836/m.58356 type:complete len:98 (+) Transcript_26836:1501-1794(+)